MIVYKNHNPSEDPICFLGFEEISDKFNERNIDFFYGGFPNDNALRNRDKTKKAIFFSTEEQAWQKDSTDSFSHEFDKILTICPPNVTGRQKREFVFFPFPENFIPTSFEKKYDVIYAGAAGGDHVEEIINSISKFNYVFVGFTGDPRITHRGISYKEKINLYSQSKISALHNLTNTGTPQIKTRPFEAAFSKSLILCKRDPWNIIEYFFEPEKEFFYYENGADLQEKISYILSHYEEYTTVIEAAYNRAISNYTSKHFIERYVK